MFDPKAFNGLICDDAVPMIRLRAADPFQLAFQIVGIVGNDRRR
jgi:hypothetical protein